MTLILYFLAILDDGDYENDWLTHLPVEMRPPVWLFGQFLAGADITTHSEHSQWFWLARLLSLIRDLLLSLS